MQDSGTHIYSSVERRTQRPVARPLTTSVMHAVLRLVISFVRPEWEIQQINDKHPAIATQPTQPLPVFFIQIKSFIKFWQPRGWIKQATQLYKIQSVRHANKK